MPEPVTEKTVITVSIKTWWQFAIIVGTLAISYWSVKADTEQALKLSKETAAAQAETNKTVTDMQRNIQSVTDDVKWFRLQYERDMQRYIREPGRNQ